MSKKFFISLLFNLFFVQFILKLLNHCLIYSWTLGVISDISLACSGVYCFHLGRSLVINSLCSADKTVQISIFGL